MRGNLPDIYTRTTRDPQNLGRPDVTSPVTLVVGGVRTHQCHERALSFQPEDSKVPDHADAPRARSDETTPPDRGTVVTEPVGTPQRVVVRGRPYLDHRHSVKPAESEQVGGERRQRVEEGSMRVENNHAAQPGRDGGA